MNAKFEISDDKISFEITGGSLQDALEVLLEKLPRANRTKLAAQRNLDQKNRLHIPCQLLEAAQISPDGLVIVSYDSTFDCIQIRRPE